MFFTSKAIVLWCIALLQRSELRGLIVRLFSLMNHKNNTNNIDRSQARHWYFQGWSIAKIARELNIKPATVHSWKKRDGWERAGVIDRIEDSLEADTIRLINKQERTEADEKRLKANFIYLERTAKIKHYQAAGNDKIINGKLSNRGKKTNKEKNELTEEHVEQLKVWFDKTFLKWGYQKKWWEAKFKHKIRNILKSRQIGATYYFAHEALLDALETGDNQIFLSATKAQAFLFRDYIIHTVREVCGVELKGGDRIELPNGATLYFLATNKHSAQGYHGHLYLDEYFWIHGFEAFQRVTSGMAMHDKWRETYFSTPSSMAHEAYPFWTGEHFNKDRPKKEHIKVDTSHKKLRNGHLGEDDQWRHMVTVEDAVADGCDLFNIEKLRRKYAGATFDNLLMCKFIDDTASAFNFKTLERCQVESYVAWNNFVPYATRPYGDLPVWCGYDPSRSRDDASFVVIAPPLVSGGKFRLLERHTWQNKDFEAQAREIFKILERYKVDYIGIDTSGLGVGVYELVKKKFSQATAIVYSIETKNRLVIKAQNVFNNGRFEFDFIDQDVVSSFTSIRKVSKGDRTTYEAGRSQDTGHADVAWAIMHALDNEPLTAVLEEEISTHRSVMEIS